MVPVRRLYAVASPPVNVRHSLRSVGDAPAALAPAGPCCERQDCFCERILRDGAFCQGLSRPYSRRFYPPEPWRRGTAARAMLSLCEGAFAIGVTCLLIKTCSFWLSVNVLLSLRSVGDAPFGAGPCRGRVVGGAGWMFSFFDFPCRFFSLSFCQPAGRLGFSVR